MIKLTFMWWLLTGTVTPGDMHEDHRLYNVWFEDGKVAENMYKGEVLHYIATGDLEYNDFYEFPDKEEESEEAFYSKN